MVSEEKQAELASALQELEAARQLIAQLQAAQGQAGGSGAQFQQPVKVENGDVIGGDQINIFIEQFGANMRRPLTGDLKQAAEKYLTYLRDRHSYLSLHGIGPVENVPLKLKLLELYVPLKARLELPEGETWQRLQLAGRDLQEEGQERQALSEPLPVLDLLRKQSGLVLLGDPGAGKTTFLKYLTLTLARGEGDELGLGARLPLLLPLAAYANALGEGKDLRLDRFIAGYFCATCGDLPVEDLLAQALESGTALVLLDGLDEVKDAGLRATVVARVLDFYNFQRRQGNKFVITSRVVGYRELRPVADELAEAMLTDFDEEEIAAFMMRWTVALEKQVQGESQIAKMDAEREQTELLEAVRRNPGVRRLAANPLLLTILALMKRKGVTLPERRVELYEQYVRTLLSMWNRARSLGGRAAGKDLDVVETVRILAPLALWMHTANPGAGLARRADLCRQLEEIYRQRGSAEPDGDARRLLHDVHEHTALLLERGAGEYGFIHLTFEEYLAAVGIALQGQGDAAQIAAALQEHAGQPAWREVILLAVAYIGLIQQLERVAGEVVERMSDPEAGADSAVLAGEAVIDAQSGVPSTSKEMVSRGLLRVMQSADVEPVLRRRAGLALGGFGWLPPDLDELVIVNGGEFLYGDEKKPRTIPYDFWIGKYLVSNSQFARFIEDGGYQKQEMWNAAGWEWRKKQKKLEPYLWHDPEWNNPLFPVVGVNWYEAQAYCRWLDGQWHKTHKVTIPEGYACRLPKEEEWEYAARGSDGRSYPWGEDFDLSKVNADQKAGGTTAVVTYSLGASPCGACDMSGNVWEWTDSWYDKEEKYRVVRGGSWFNVARLVRCAGRDGDDPADYDVSIGFRYVLSLASSDF